MIAHARDHDHLYTGRRITWIGMAVNAVLIAAKLFGGFAGHSRALLADAVHSLSDLVTDFVVLVGLHFLGKKADAEHPYGHGKIETLATLGVGLVLLAAAVKIGYDAATAVAGGELPAPHRYTIAIAAFSIIAKEALYQATVRAGRRAGSEAMVANAWHHRSDAWTSVVTLVGVALASYVPRLRVLDSYAALLVSFFIIKVAVDILGRAARKIVDTAPSGRFIDEVCETAEAVDGVIECHDVMARYYGPVIRMELHIVVDPLISVLQAHGIIDRVVDAVKARFPEVGKILVHVDPRRKPDGANGDIEGSTV